MELKYKGNKVLITGGSSELGLYMASLALNSGLYPILSYRNNKGKLKIKKHLESFTNYSTILLDNEKVETLDNIPNIDYMVDFSHTNYESLVSNSSAEKLKKYILSNQLYKTLLLQRVTSKMAMNKFGRLIYISSTSAQRINPGQGLYSSSKAAIETLYKTCGVELARLGVTTVILRPGYINCGRGALFAQKREKELKKIIPTKKVLSVEEVCENVMFLMSDSSLSINSTEITIDGGMSFLK